MNAVYVTVHAKTIKEKALDWSGCNVSVKGGSMKNVSVLICFPKLVFLCS